MYDESSQPQQYLLEVEKLMSSDIQSTYWSHNMDLLVIVTVDNVLQLYRISFKAQKVFQVEQDKEITAVAFSPDSQYISYGMNDGEIKVLKTQNGQTLLTVSDHLAEQIKSFSFVELATYPATKIFPFKSCSLPQKLLLQISPHKNCNKQAIIKLNYFNEMHSNEHFTLLLSSSEKHTALHLNGFVTIAQVNYEMIVAKGLEIASNNSHQNYLTNRNSMNDTNPTAQYTIHHSHFNPHTYQLQTILVQSTPHSYILHHISLNSMIIKQLQPNIIKLNCLLSYVNEIIDFVEMSYPAAENILRDILRQYNQKMVLIDDPQRSDVNPCQELFKYLNYGITSTPIVNFLTKQVYDTKVLQKLDETINAGFNSLHELLLQSIQNSLQRAYLIVHQLKGLCQLEKYRVFGISGKDLQVVEKQVEKLYTMGEVLLVESTEAKFDIRNLLVWLNKATIKTSSDPNNEIQNTKSHLSRYTVDFTRLHSFIETEEKFKLQNLVSFFSKGQQQFQMKIPQCEFRLLGKKDTKKSQQFIKRTREIELQLCLEDIVLEGENKMLHQKQQLQYRSFRLQLKNLKTSWKSLKIKPVIELSKKIESQYEVRKIAQIEASEFIMFQLKHALKKNEETNQDELVLYFIQHDSRMQTNKLVEYNTISNERRWLTVPNGYMPLSLAVGVDVVMLLENTMGMNDEKIIVQVTNEEWKGEEIIFGKKIQKLNGEIHLNAGLRGLNLMVVNKNKLVVFSAFD